MFRIRLHGRGGQGIKTAGQILGSAFFMAGFEVQDAPRYGAERRGAPILAGVRAARTPINERGAITQADLVVVADPSLLQVPTAGVLEGAGPGSVLLILSGDAPSQWRERLACSGLIVTVDPAADMAHPAIPLVGAAARMTGVITGAILAQAMRTELSALGEKQVNHELGRAMRAFNAFAPHEGTVREAPMPAVRDTIRPDWVDLPLEPASVAAPDIRAGANSARSQTGFWRVQRPVIDYQHCNRCSWICSTLCPDSAINIGADRSPVIDYDHCKGCLVCVTVCPPHAITVVPEQSAQAVSKLLGAR